MQFAIVSRIFLEALFGSLKEASRFSITLDNGEAGTFLVHSIEREDGSGNCWNVTGTLHLFRTDAKCGLKVSGFMRTNQEGSTYGGLLRESYGYLDLPPDEMWEEDTRFSQQ